MTSKLVLLGCGALMALTQAAHGADAEALSEYLNETAARASYYGYHVAISIKAHPCAISFKYKMDPDESLAPNPRFGIWDPLSGRTPSKDIYTLRLDYVDLASADVRLAKDRRDYKSLINIRWEGDSGARIAEAQREVMQADRDMQRQINALGLDPHQEIVAVNKAAEQLATEVRSGTFGPYAAAATVETHRQIRDYLPDMHRFGVLDQFNFGVKPGTEQAVIDALNEWRAETCTGN
jgi:hypothetical protein